MVLKYLTFLLRLFVGNESRIIKKNHQNKSFGDFFG
jgi:hypothetical protein